jgi:hypothetical protein
MNRGATTQLLASFDDELHGSGAAQVQPAGALLHGELLTQLRTIAVMDDGRAFCLGS